MAKKISDIQRIISFAMAADEGALNTAIESLIAVRVSRFPKDRKARKPRKSRQPELPGTEDAK